MSRDAEVKALLDKADTTLDTEARKKTYAEALTRIADKANLLPMFSYSSNYAFSSELDFSAQPDEMPRFYA
ncbi:ABC transporter substrate-binding protein, partial [Mycobacterium tuberculosis]|nr:ABC transporter substrate-binding protein [Mycobacterium tuberculosis]